MHLLFRIPFIAILSLLLLLFFGWRIHSNIPDKLEDYKGKQREELNRSNTHISKEEEGEEEMKNGQHEANETQEKCINRHIDMLIS